MTANQSINQSLKVCFASSDNQFDFKRGLISSSAIYTVKSGVNEYCGILSGSRAVNRSTVHLRFTFVRIRS